MHMFTFIVTNMDFSPEELIHFCCKRGILYPFLRHLIRNMATERFNNKETELFCQDYTGVNNSG